MNLDSLQGATVTQWCSFCASAPAVAIVADEGGEEWDTCENCLSLTGVELPE